MIFEGVNHITSKDEFLEKISIYKRLVEVTAERYNLTIPSQSICTSEVVTELCEMGILNSSDEMSTLANILKKDFMHFISCVDFYLNNKELFGTQLDKLSNKKRKEAQKEEAKAKKPTFVDFFAGAGGLSCGFTHAGFKVVFANDFEDVCIRTYKYNHPELPSHKVLQGDIRKIVDNIEDYVKDEVDMVVGGPPCQGFSSANQQRIIDDPRNELYKYFLKAVSALLPKFVVMENVKGMLKVADQVVEDYESICVEKNNKTYSYKVAYKLLNSVDFSVAQSRERLIYIAVRNDVAEAHSIEPKDIFIQIEKATSKKPIYILADALAHIKKLEAPREKNTNEVDSELTGKKIDINLHKGDENEYLKLINGGREIPFLLNHKARYVNDINYDIYRLLDQGDDASDPKIADIMPYSNRLHCFKDKYYKLRADKPSRTITAHLRMDCHSHIHPFQVRALTPREAARCQSFPDDYLFLGAYLKTYMQIGNAVPCLMAKGIAEIIKKYL